MKDCCWRVALSNFPCSWVLKNLHDYPASVLRPCTFRYYKTSSSLRIHIFSEDRITTSRGQGFFPFFFGPHVGNVITLNHFIKKSLDVICTMPWYCWPAHIWLLPTLKPPSYVRTSRFSMPPNWYTHAQTKQRGICYGRHTPVYKPTVYLHAWCSKSLKDNWKGFWGFTSSD